MTLLHAAAATIPRERLLVATFDHAPSGVAGAPSTRAARLVGARATALGLPVVCGRSAMPRLVGPSEAAWRDDRWRFLHEVAARTGGTIVTAHTRDDQVETVLMRVLRGAGARGLAALYANSPVVRPLLRTARAEVLEYARSQRVRWFEDPTNQSRRFFRNRVRMDLLPALRQTRPDIDADLLAIAKRAGDWRRQVDDAVQQAVEYRASADSLDVALPSLVGYSRASLGIIWPVLASRIGVALDWRGTRRLVEFTIRGRSGARIQLAGGWEVTRSRGWLELHRQEGSTVAPVALGTRTVFWSRWRFCPLAQRDDADAWAASLPVGVPLTVRGWQPGDTMAFRADAPARKVKRFLTDAGISGRRRISWPVVLAGDEIIWIPGVCRSHAATDRSGRPARPYRCDVHDR